MRAILTPRMLGAILGLLVLCSCATPPQPSPITAASELPAEVTMNKDAGRGIWVFVTIRLESGEELPFVVDTGATWTLFDKSLEPKLGRRLGTKTTSIWGVKKKFGRYAAPKLYLGSTPLMTGPDIYTSDHLNQVSSESHRPIMGLLGIDCLKHYCIQMDFEAGKMLFLDRHRVNAAGLGQAFPLTLRYLPFIHRAGLVARKGENWSMIDTGCNIDGLLQRPLFRREVQGGRDVSISTNKTSRGGVHDNVWLPECVWNGDSYTNLLIGTGADLIGLRFLARHLVTFDFPNRTMYLKQRSVGPLPGDNLVEKTAAAIAAPAEFLEGLKEKGQLPGWSKNDHGELFCIYHPEGDSNSYTFAFRENADSSTRHYRVTRSSKESPWKLQRAWRTDQNDQTVEEYPCPYVL